MKIVIGIEKDNLSSCQIKKQNKVIDWSELTRDEQIKILNSISSHYNLLNRFIKSE